MAGMLGPFVRRRPRLTAAVAFGAAATALCAAWFLPSVLSRRDGVALALYVAAPGAAAALAGDLAGAPLCDPTRSLDTGRVLLRGAGVATLALVIFAPLFAVLFTWIDPGRSSVLGMLALVLAFSAVAVWWFVAVVGSAVGWLLRRLASG